MGLLGRLFKKAVANTPSGAPSPGGRLVAANELAGFFAAHAVWCVSEGETLIPLAGFEDAKGQRTLVRFGAERIEQGVVNGETWLATNPRNTRRAAFIFDAFITVGSGKTDALIVKVRDFTDGDAAMEWAVPYRSAKSPGGFAVHRPKAVFASAADSTRAVALGEAFWRGIAAHEKAADVWNKHLDESR